MNQMLGLPAAEPAWANAAAIVLVWAAILFSISMMALVLLATARWVL